MTEINTSTTTQVNKNIFLKETIRKKTPQNFLSIELNQISVKPRQLLLSSFSCTNFSLSCKTTGVREYKWRGPPPYLYSSVDLASNLTIPTFLTVWVDLSSKTPKITFIILTLGYYWPNLHSEVYIDSFNDSYKTKPMSRRRNIFNTYWNIFRSYNTLTSMTCFITKPLVIIIFNKFVLWAAQNNPYNIQKPSEA